MPVNTIADTDIFLISKDNGDGTFTSYKVTGSQMKSNFKGLSNFTEGVSTTSPNNTVNVTFLSANTSSTNGDFVIMPKGNGAILAAIPDGTSTGGNKRGTNAIDLQTLRTASTQVASGTGGVVIGTRNTSSSSNPYVGGVAIGNNNAASNGSVAIGEGNTSNGVGGVAIGSGSASGTYGAAIGYGSTSTGTNFGYAIGRQSQANNESYSFGWGVISNGQYSVSIGASSTTSGQYAAALGRQNTSSGSNSVAIGQSNISSGSNSYSMGYGNTAAGYNGVVALGWSNTITAGASYGAFAAGMQNGVSGVGFAIGVQNSVSNGCALGSTNTATNGVALGTSNTVDAGGSTAIGKQASVFGIKGRVAYSAGQVSALGDSQASKFILQRRTTDATATTLISDAVSSPTPYLSNQVILSNNSAYGFTGTIIAKQAGSTNAALWKVEGLLVRGASAGATVLLSPTITLVSNVPNWGTPTLAADTSNGGLKVDVIGAAATNIQWTAVIETTEVIYA
jgi:hypothetical protein